uniref:Salivary lipocalin n=1 Tax=Ornithodoros brasiliensis TaxID=888526 RepID=A0A1D2AJA6_ORNBR
MDFTIAVTAFTLLAAVYIAKADSDCKVEAKDQVAWQVVKAAEKESFYLFRTTKNRLGSCSYLRVNQTDDTKKSGILLSGFGLGADVEAASFVGKGNVLNVGKGLGAECNPCRAVTQGPFPLLYTDNTTCSVFATPDENDILLYAAASAAPKATFHTCCKKIFKREARKAKKICYNKFSKKCLKSTQD